MKKTYFISFISAGIAYVSLVSSGFLSWAFVCYSFVLIPFIELFFKGSTANLSPEQEEVAKKNPVYDWLLYLIFIAQWVLVITFLRVVQTPWPPADLASKILTLGITCGVFGINVAHELGHRKDSFSRFLAKGLLLTAQYMHFIVEHNHGHHKNVATPEDGSTARKNEPLFIFWFRSIFVCYLGGWKIQMTQLKKQNHFFWSIKNNMLWFLLIQFSFLVCIGILFNYQTMGYMLLASTIGVLLLETVNYVEHYGLMRARNSKGNYIAVQPIHSWNSNHPIGRGLLFELSRHSDHHYRASRKYQVLRSFDQAPQMPTGYPGMVVMAFIPPLWFWVMNKKVENLQKQYPDLLQ